MTVDEMSYELVTSMKLISGEEFICLKPEQAVEIARKLIELEALVSARDKC